MEYQIALSPDLGISPEEFVAAWNEATEARSKAEANLSQVKGNVFEPITLAVILVTIATGVATDVLSELIKDLIQDIREKRKQQSAGAAPHQKIHVEQVDKPDGTHDFWVDIEH